MPRAREGFCQLVGKAEQLESKLPPGLPAGLATSTTALFWVELQPCICFGHCMQARVTSWFSVLGGPCPAAARSWRKCVAVLFVSDKRQHPFERQLMPPEVSDYT